MLGQLARYTATPATAAPARCERGCPPDAQTRVGGILLTGHRLQCGALRLRQYVWQDAAGLTADGLAVGDLADYGAAFAETYRHGRPGVSTQIRTWDAAYQVETEVVFRDEESGQLQVRLAVPGEEVIVDIYDY
jgi:hypothetical protein